MVQVVLFRFQQCLLPFTCCFAKNRMKLDFFEIWLTTFFWVHNVGNTATMKVILLLKMFKILSSFQNCRNKFRKCFFFWDNCIWIGCLKLSLLRRENLSSAVNMLTNILRLSISLKAIFCKWIDFTVSNKYGKGGVVQISTVFGPPYHVTLRRACETTLFRHLFNHVFGSL